MSKTIHSGGRTTSTPNIKHFVYSYFIVKKVKLLWTEFLYSSDIKLYKCFCIYRAIDTLNIGKKMSD